MKVLWNVIRVVTLLAVLAAAPLGIWRGFENEDSPLHFARYWMALMLPLIGVGLLALWYLIFGWGAFGRRAKHFGIFALVALIGYVGFRAAFRYDGSTSGASLPRFAFRWAPEAIHEPEELPDAGTETARRPLEETAVEGVIDSPQFYGPNRDATWPADQVIASLDWTSKAPIELWRQPIGGGWSGFAVVGRRALTMEQRGSEEWVSCYDLLSGEVIWTHRDEARFYESAVSGAKEMAGDGPRAVPTVSGDHVFTYGATGVLNCLSLETGEAIWQHLVITNLGKPLPEWGKSTSPLVIDDLGLVVVTGAENGSPTLLAFRADTGEPAWRYEGQGTSYSSPRLMRLHGERQVVSVNGHDVTGHEPETGEERWRFDWPGRFPKVCQPIEAGDNRILVTASYGAGAHLLEIGKEGDTWTVDSLWKSTRLKTKFSSAVVRDGHAYALDEGRFACVNLEDGSRVWKDGKYGFGQQLLVGDALLVQAEAGYVAVVEATPAAFREISRVDALDSMTWNPPTLAGRYLLVRNDREVVCFQLPEKAAGGG